jgi:putative membrane protein
MGRRGGDRSPPRGGEARLRADARGATAHGAAVVACGEARLRADARGATAHRARRRRRVRRGYASAVLAILAITWVFNTLALYVATWLLSGLSYGSDWWTPLVAGLVFTIVNTFVKPVIAILSIPFIIVTLGLFYFLINVFVLYLTHWIVSDFTIENFWWAALAAVIISIVNGLLHATVGRPHELAAG